MGETTHSIFAVVTQLLFQSLLELVRGTVSLYEVETYLCMLLQYTYLSWTYINSSIYVGRLSALVPKAGEEWSSGLLIHRPQLEVCSLVFQPKKKKAPLNSQIRFNST